MRWVLPKLSVNSALSGTTVSQFRGHRGRPARPRVRPGLSTTMRRKSSNCAMLAPSIARIRSPARKTGPLSGTPRDHLIDHRRRLGLPRGHEKPGQKNDGESEISGRPGGDDQRPVPQGLVMKRHLPLIVGPAAVVGLARARRVAITEHFDVTAKRDRRKLPACATRRRPAE